MKLTAVFLLAALLQVSARGFTQSISLNKINAPLQAVFQEIETQSGYQFFYKILLEAKFKKVTVQLNNVTLKQALREVLKDQPLSYEIVNKTIVIKEKETQIVNLNTFFPPPPIDLHGRVLNEKNEPLEGITVTLKGTKVATQTDANGFFELKDIGENAVLSFTSVNTEPYEVKVNGNKDLTIKLKIRVSSLNDVTVEVNTGYQQILKESATGSFEKIDNNLFNRSVSTDVLSHLDGIASSVYFSKVHSSNEIFIRGISTINAGTAP
ncbi:MAG: STN and carboxypeptidase regulatory-like domain-containing protein, partial [Chitinophagaceae bacterium]